MPSGMMTNPHLVLVLFAASSVGSGCAHERERLSSRPDTLSAPLIIPADEARWRATKFKGVEAAVLWGDPDAELRGAELLRIAPDLAFPEHTHSYDERVLVLSGPFVFMLPGANERQLQQGSYYYLPAGVVHSSRCAAAMKCLVYSEVIPRTEAKR